MGDLQKIEPPADPAELSYPATLPIEVALRNNTLEEIRIDYGYSPEEWAALRYNPAFLADLKVALEMVKREGMSFRLKARLQADELLKQSWRMIHAGDAVPPSVKADLIKSTMRWAGYDVKETAGAAAGTGLNIQINLR